MADLKLILKGLQLKHPVLPGPGPNASGAAAAAAMLQGGAAAVLLQTVTVRPDATNSDPARAAYGRDGAFHRQPALPVPFETWLGREFSLALAAARAAGVPCIPSIGYRPDEVRRMAAVLSFGGADALFYDTTHAERGEIVEGALAIKDVAPQLPLIVKLSPHHGDDLANLAAELEPCADAFCLIGSFGPDLLIDPETAESPLGGVGFLSGAPIRPVMQRFVYEVARRVSRPVIAWGGITSGAEAAEAMMLGASAVMLSTHTLLKGPDAYGRVAAELDAWLDQHGYHHVGEIQRAFIRKYGRGQRVVLEKEECPQLNEAACIKCTFCEQVCFYDAIKAPPKTLPTISEEPCFECGLCVSACPTGALFFRPRDEVTMLPAGGA